MAEKDWPAELGRCYSVMVSETGWDWFHGGGVKLGMNPHHSTKEALQGVKIFAQEPTLSIFRIFAVLQRIQNRLIHDRHEQTFGSSCLGVAGQSLHTRNLLFGVRESYGRRFRNHKAAMQPRAPISATTARGW